MENNIWAIVCYHFIISPRKQTPLTNIVINSRIDNIYGKENIVKFTYELNNGKFQVEIE